MFGRNDNNFHIIRMNVPKKANILISACQINKSKFKNYKIDYVYSFIRIMIGRIEHIGLKFISGQYIQAKSTLLNENFQEGQYIIIIECDWLQNVNRTINFSKNINLYKFKFIFKDTQSSCSIILESDKNQSQENLLLIQRNLISSLSKSDSSYQKISDYSKYSQNKLFR